MTWLRPRRPSAAMIVALIALMVALGGTSYAAFSLPKNSVGTKQLKKNAVTTPKIKNGAVTAGKINPAGLTVPSATNANHATSATSAASATSASSASTLAAGRTLTGDYAVDGDSTYADATVTFAFPLSSAPKANYIAAGTTPPTQCPGSPANPEAAPGNLCIYEITSTNVGAFCPFAAGVYFSSCGTVDKQGFGVEVFPSTSGSFVESVGTWAVTAS